MVEGTRLNVVDGRLSWQTVRPKTQGSRPRLAILEVAVEYGLNWHLKGKNTPYFTATYREMGLQAGEVVGLSGGFAGADEVGCGFLGVERLVKGHGLAADRKHQVNTLLIHRI